MNEILEHSALLSENQIPVVAILRVMEESARKHTIDLGIDRRHMLNTYGAVWMIARTYLHLKALPIITSPLTIRTWHRGLYRGIVYRDYDIIQSGVIIGEAVQSWVLVDFNSRTLIRMDKLPELQNVPRPGIIKSIIPGKPFPPHPLQKTSSFFIDEYLVDENKHLNNTSYVDLVMNLIPNSAYTISTLKINYRRECFANNYLPCLSYKDDHQYFARLLTPTNQPAFDLLATFDNSLNQSII